MSLEEIKGSGFHFLACDMDCHWKFYIRHVLRFEPNFTHPALMFGSGIHAGVAEFHLTYDLNKVTQVFIQTLEARKKEYENDETFTQDINRGVKLIEDYCLTWSSDEKNYSLIANEKELNIEIGGFKFCFRIDRIMKDRRNGLNYIFEVKTSGYLTPEKCFNKVQEQDQVTAYIYSYMQMFPDQPIEGAIPDILYQNKGVYRCERPSEVYRDKTDLLEWSLGAPQQVSEITQRVKSLGALPAIQVFYRNPTCCGDGFYSCEYKSICRTRLVKDNPPFGFKMKGERT
jgi:hypothetical protein